MVQDLAKIVPFSPSWSKKIENTNSLLFLEAVLKGSYSELLRAIITSVVKNFILWLAF
jgi:hypothetical protein